MAARRPPHDTLAARTTLLARRLAAQQIAGSHRRTPRGVVAWLGAMQAQDYAGCKWALGLRLGETGVTDATIERALSAGEVLRMHVMRWTWQLVVPEDVHWMLALVRARLVARALRRHRQLGLDEATFRKSNTVLDRALRDGHHPTREELAERLEKAGISTAAERLSHLLGRAELDAIVCNGPRRGKQLTFTHLDLRARTPSPPWTRDRALAELALRYFRSRGPATLADFVWWSGLAVPEAREGLEAVRSSLESELFDGQAHFWSESPVKDSDEGGKLPPLRRVEHGASRHPVASERPLCRLLPAFDEYLVAYRKRDELLEPEHAQRLHAGGGMLPPSLLYQGRIVGAWRRELTRDGVAVELDLLAAPSRAERACWKAAAEQFGRFLGLRAEAVTLSETRASPSTPSTRRPRTKGAATIKGPSKDGQRASAGGAKRGHVR